LSFSLFKSLLPTQVADEDAADISAAVAEALNSAAFWGDLEMLNALLAPFTAVIMAMQADDATLADATRYWVYLGQELLKQISQLPIGACTALYLVTSRPAFREWSPTDTLSALFCLDRLCAAHRGGLQPARGADGQPLGPPGARAGPALQARGAAGGQAGRCAGCARGQAAPAPGRLA